MDYTEADVAALAAKLDGLELTDGERAAMAAAFVPTEDEEVSGFALNSYLTLNFGEVASRRAIFHLQQPSPTIQPDTGSGIVDCRI